MKLKNYTNKKLKDTIPCKTDKIDLYESINQYKQDTITEDDWFIIFNKYIYLWKNGTIKYSYSIRKQFEILKIYLELNYNIELIFFLNIFEILLYMDNLQSYSYNDVNSMDNLYVIILKNENNKYNKLLENINNICKYFKEYNNKHYVDKLIIYLIKNKNITIELIFKNKFIIYIIFKLHWIYPKNNEFYKLIYDLLSNYFEELTSCSVNKTIVYEFLLLNKEDIKIVNLISIYKYLI